MSHSDIVSQDAFSTAVNTLRWFEEAFLHEDGSARHDLDIQICAGLLSSAIRLFVAAANDSALDDYSPLPSFGLTPTEAVVAAAALLRDQNLTPFDLFLWFQRAASEAKKSNSFAEAVARTQEDFSQRNETAGSNAR